MTFDIESLVAGEWQRKPVFASRRKMGEFAKKHWAGVRPSELDQSS